jgi:D-alanyl-D-alanine carboxypeptidase/D-alanyl-D-alanine-endopeptidase (penicillin-binding protein 4)
VRQACVPHPDVTAEATEVAPVALTNAIETHLADERFDGAGLGLSLWIEGYGEVAQRAADLRLRPASNQKLLTAIAALDVLGPDTVLGTTIATDGLASRGVLDGNLYLVGGGDPTLRSTGSHSLERLASAVRQVGVQRIDGDVVIDESRYDDLRVVGSWGGVPVPAWVGSLSALLVDENRWSAWWADIADPAAANGRLFVEALRDQGIIVAGEIRSGVLPDDAAVITTLRSPPVRNLVQVMLEDSNNTIAEVLVKEIGYRHSGVGSTQAGLAAAADVVASLCQPGSIIQQDGSGLSHGNARSARGWRTLLQAAQAAPWWPDFVTSMAIAGETGTIRWRFLDTPAAGNLRAKTGSISGLRSLSGILTTEGGRRVFFSAIVDADEPRAPMAAIDELLVAVASDES